MISELYQEMEVLASDLEYERATVLRDRINLVEKEVDKRVRSN